MFRSLMRGKSDSCCLLYNKLHHYGLILVYSPAGLLVWRVNRSEHIQLQYCGAWSLGVGIFLKFFAYKFWWGQALCAV